jgi:arginyl-tRNA synthetase
MTGISDILRESVFKSIQKLGLEAEEVSFEHPTELSHGDYSTNISLVLAKKEKQNPKELAEKILKNLDQPKEVEKVEVAGAGFINFHLTKEFFANNLNDAIKEDFGKNESLKGKKIILEYTDPNPFKIFHIGHLMPNVVGESLARLAEYTGAKVNRISYQGDVGLHVAQAIWGLRKEGLNPHDIHDLDRAYVLGRKESENNKEEVIALNKKIFEKSNDDVNDIYDKGKKASLEYFEEMYKILGTKFDHYLFESETGNYGKEVIAKNTNVFEESDGATIFKGENYGLHTRVFINSEGLPTYEAKELGLAQAKAELFPYDLSLIVTGNEQNSYFDVVIEAMKLVYKKEEYGEKTFHIGHGLLMLPTGKMSSSKGAIPAENLIREIKDKVMELMEEREIENKEEIAEIVTVAAIKYSILKQGIGKNIIFDFDKAVSFEGDSGPYLQYTYVRAKSVLEIAKQKGIKANLGVGHLSGEVGELERMVYRFPEVVERAWEEKGPQLVVKFLIDLAGAFNSFYAQEKIAEKGGEYKILLTEATMNTLKNGLYLLGIKVPDKM